MHLVGEHQSWDPFPAVQHGNDRLDRSDAYRAIAVSAIGLGITGLIELGIAILGGSVGLLSDALHNLSDVSTSLVVFVGLRISKRPATETHPYGWNRAEDIAGLGVAVVIWLSAAFAGYVSIEKLINHGSTSYLSYGIAAAVIGILGNQIVARYKLKIGKRIQSATLIADAQHSWLDAISSAGAMFGLIGVAVGFPWADAVAGLVVTGFICHVGYEVTGDLVRHLMDGVEPGILANSTLAATSVEGVAHAHVRARWMGRSLIVEVEGFISPEVTIEAGAKIGDDVESAIHEAVPEARIILWIPKPITEQSDIQL